MIYSPSFSSFTIADILVTEMSPKRNVPRKISPGTFFGWGYFENVPDWSLGAFLSNEMRERFSDESRNAKKREDEFFGWTRYWKERNRTDLGK